MSNQSNNSSGSLKRFSEATKPSITPRQTTTVKRDKFSEGTKRVVTVKKDK